MVSLKTTRGEGKPSRTPHLTQHEWNWPLCYFKWRRKRNWNQQWRCRGRQGPCRTVAQPRSSSSNCWTTKEISMVKRRQGIIWVLHQERTREQRIPEKTVCLWEEHYKQELLQDVSEQRVCDREREIKIKSELSWQSKMRYPEEYKLNIKELWYKNYLQQDKKFRRTQEQRREDPGEKTEMRIR